MIDGYVRALYDGQASADIMLTDLAMHTAGRLLDGYVQGYEKPLFGPDWTAHDNALLTRVQANLFAFSGAKTYAEMKDLRDSVYDAKGNLLPWADFKAKAQGINARYNLTYLEAERQAVITSGTMGSRWVEIEQTASTHPYLQYVTAGDNRVRSSHAALNGIILPVDSAFWQQYYPPNGWRCRCYVRRLTEREAEHRRRQAESRGRELPDEETAQKIGGRAADKQWRHNVGTSEIFERDGHPYFRSSKAARDMQLSATRNYGMPSVERIYDRPAWLSKYGQPLASREEYAAYWQRMRDEHPAADGRGFTLTDKARGVMAHFPESLYDKMINRGRMEYFGEAEAVFSDPDEIWYVLKGSKKQSLGTEIFTTYVKYYEDIPIIMPIDENGTVNSLYKWTGGLKDFESWRTGILKYKKR